jgi:hypothetical protein
VIQGLGRPDDDRRGGFERGGWALPLFDDEAETLLAEVYQRADAFLFGRRTYEIFAGYWGVRADSGPIAAALNTRPKYVASTTLTDPQWADNRGPPPAGWSSRPTGPPGARSTQLPTEAFSERSLVGAGTRRYAARA